LEVLAVLMVADLLEVQAAVVEPSTLMVRVVHLEVERQVRQGKDLRAALALVQTLKTQVTEAEAEALALLVQTPRVLLLVVQVVLELIPIQLLQLLHLLE
jgi:hypothetical protein